MKSYALITGSADRIGKAIAFELANQGYQLVLHYNRSKEKILKVQQELETMGVVIKLLSINFLGSNDYRSIFQQLKEEGIEIRMLVNCASDFKLSTFQDRGSELLEKQFKINFESAYSLTKAYADVFDKGHIINFLDTKIEKNFTNRLDYILSKKSLKDFTFLSAVELAPRFRVNAIAPGLVLPPEGKDEKYLMDLAQEIPMKTIGNVGDIIKAFRYLLESTFVTGQILYVDGGDHLI